MAAIRQPKQVLCLKLLVRVFSQTFHLSKIRYYTVNALGGRKIHKFDGIDEQPTNLSEKDACGAPLSNSSLSGVFVATRHRPLHPISSSQPRAVRPPLTRPYPLKLPVSIMQPLPGRDVGGGGQLRRQVVDP